MSSLQQKILGLHILISILGFDVCNNGQPAIFITIQGTPTKLEYRQGCMTSQFLRYKKSGQLVKVAIDYPASQQE